jgi:RNA-splicing ligase RtcB|nr:MAG TPA_asm: tRNA-splicing ligase RtcB [Caudoviricetes sp.]
MNNVEQLLKSKGINKENIEVAQELLDLKYIILYPTRISPRPGKQEVIKEYLSRHSKIKDVHNYIDLEHGILRKGAIAAYKGVKVIIPINMAEGSIIGIGKGCAEMNYSAPHGAGRMLSRIKAKENLNIEEFKASMVDVWSSCVNKDTLDESPMAYKSLKDIVPNIKDTVDIVEVIKPIYNFKASE